MTHNLIGEKKQIFKLILNQIDPNSAAKRKDRMEIEGEEEAVNLVEIMLEPNVSASHVRQDIFRSDDMPEFNKFETSLQQLFKIGD